MKEKFRSWNPKNFIKIKYVGADGMPGIWKIEQKVLLDYAVQIINEYVEAGIVLTIRQLYYQFVARGVIPNSGEIYKRMCAFLVDARYSGLIDWDAIEDRGRVPNRHSEWKDVSELIDSAIYSYRLPRWNDQEFHVELYCEKQAMEGVLKPIADQYHVHFGVNKGYSSASTLYSIAQRMKSEIRKGKHVVLLYMGDHDPSGLDMVRDLRSRIGEFIYGGEQGIDFLAESEEIPFQVDHIALKTDQVQENNLPPTPAKIDDPRAKWYIEKHGNISWELDALEPQLLMEIAEEGILKYLNWSKYNAWIKKEDEDKRKLTEFGRSIK